MRHSIALALFSAATLAACGPTVLFKRNADAPIGPQARWAWSPPDGDGLSIHDGALVPADSIARLISDAIESELTAKGYARTVPESAQFVVHFHVGLRRVVDTVPQRRERVRVGDTRATWGGYGDPEALDERVIEWEEGLLVIDAVLPNDHVVAWRGLIAGEVPERATTRPGPAIREAVQRVFKGFP